MPLTPPTLTTLPLRLTLPPKARYNASSTAVLQLVVPVTLDSTSKSPAGLPRRPTAVLSLKSPILINAFFRFDAYWSRSVCWASSSVCRNSQKYTCPSCLVSFILPTNTGPKLNRLLFWSFINSTMVEKRVGSKSKAPRRPLLFSTSGVLCSNSICTQGTLPGWRGNVPSSSDSVAGSSGIRGIANLLISHF